MARVDVPEGDGKEASRIWQDLAGNSNGWSGLEGYLPADNFLAGVQLLIYGCQTTDGLMIENPSPSNKDCEHPSNHGSWVLMDTALTDAQGAYSFDDLLKLDL